MTATIRIVKKKMMMLRFTLQVLRASYRSTDHRQATDHRPHRQVLDRPTNHRPPTTEPPTSVLPTHRQLLHRRTFNRSPTSDKCSIDSLITDSPTLLQLTKNPLTQQSFFNRGTTGPILSITNFNSSFGMGTIYY